MQETKYLHAIEENLKMHNYKNILIQNHGTHRNMMRILGGDPEGKVSKLLDFTERTGQDIADPWYTGNFDRTYEDVKEGCEALLQDCLLRL